ncbi:MAG: SLC13 family permease, partial [Gammaproteobacteria bacterium]|nr:SLC13 family permease [Gammaproteobacteria bacterium]
MTTVTPDAHGVAVILLIVTALFLFTRDRMPLESTSLAVIIVLVLGFHAFPYEVDGVPLDPAQFFMGFGNEALITICSLIVIGKALETTGALQPVARLASNMWFKRPRLALLMMLVSVFVLSACMNDTPIVVLMIPILIGISSRTNLPASRFLLPMGLATIIGGMCTTIGTSTNLLVVGITRDLGVADIGIFDFALPAVLVGAVGLIFVWLIVPRLLPDRVRPITDTRPRKFDAQLTVREDGFAAGKTLKDVLDKTEGDMHVEQIKRGESLILMKLPLVKLQPGDHLLVKDTPENLKRFERLIGASLYDESDSEDTADAETLPKGRDQQVAQIVVTRDSPLYGQSLPDIHFIAFFGLVPLAVHCAREPGEKEVANLNQVRLREGDVVLVQGSRAALDAIKASNRMLVLDDTTDLPRAHRAKRSLVVLAMVIGFAALGLLPISITAIIGVGLMIALGCLSWRDVGRSLPVAVIML